MENERGFHWFFVWVSCLIRKEHSARKGPEGPQWDETQLLQHEPRYVTQGTDQAGLFPLPRAPLMGDYHETIWELGPPCMDTGQHWESIPAIFSPPRNHPLSPWRGSWVTLRARKVPVVFPLGCTPWHGQKKTHWFHTITPLCFSLLWHQTAASQPPEQTMQEQHVMAWVLNGSTTPVLQRTWARGPQPLYCDN